MNDYVYIAKFINDEIIIDQYDIIESSQSTVTINNNNRKFIYTIDAVAFSKEDAIRVLVNNYSYRIDCIRETIKNKQQEISELQQLIPELLFEQRKLENRKY